jgi:hypothetical protein
VIDSHSTLENSNSIADLVAQLSVHSLDLLTYGDYEALESERIAAYFNSDPTGDRIPGICGALEESGALYQIQVYRHSVVAIACVAALQYHCSGDTLSEAYHNLCDFLYSSQC